MKWVTELLIATLFSLDLLVLSDLHLDLNYVDRSSPTTRCSQLDSRQEKKIMGQPGCDLSTDMLESALLKAKEINPDPDLLVLPGDFLPHDVARYGVDEVQRTFQTVVEKLQTHFPETQIALALGNNDYFHISKPQEVEGHLQFLSELWTPLTGTMSESFREAGYYSALTRSGHMVVSLNTNFFSITTSTHSRTADLQLDWLESQLHSAEVSSHPVLLVMHHPPGAGMFLGNSYNWHTCFIYRFQELIERYEQSISLILAGHLHKYGIQLFPKTSKGVFVHASLSPVYGNNPGFRHYQLTETSQDYTDYFYHLDVAQSYWTSEFNYSTYFGLSTFDFPAMYEKLTGNEELYAFLRYESGLYESNLSREAFWKLTVGLQDETEMQQVALCSYKYMSNFDFELCKWGMLPTS